MKGHPFFRTTQWALIRHMKPPMVPNQGRGIDTVNFRNVKESESVDISGSRPMPFKKGLGLNLGDIGKVKGVPLDSSLETPGGLGDNGEELAVDPFEEFNSVTLHHDGDDHGHHEDQQNGRYDR